MASPTATTTSRMALRVSTEPKGPPVPIRIFPLPTEEVPDGIGATAPPGSPGAAP